MEKQRSFKRTERNPEKGLSEKAVISHSFYIRTRAHVSGTRGKREKRGEKEKKKERNKWKSVRVKWERGTKESAIKARGTGLKRSSTAAPPRGKER